MRKIKMYYRIKFELTSPLSVGCGVNNITERDIVLDGRGMPYIPGSALAGVYRQLFSKETADRYFGAEMTEERLEESVKKGKNTLTESSILVYDASILNPEQRAITTRDVVALDEYKVSISGKKFDFQVLEPGIQFVTYVEQNMTFEEEQYVLQEIAYAWMQEKIRLGAKTGRGYGYTKAVELATYCFDLTNEKDRKEWLEFDMYGDDHWKICEMPKCLGLETPECQSAYMQIYEKHKISVRRKKELFIQLGLKQCGEVSVRQYSTNIDEEDYMQMTRKNQTPFIPGTSWAGAFRAQMGKLDSEFGKDKRLTELFFGKVKRNDGTDSHKTRITFSETELHGGERRTYTRNAIDRFSGGTVDGALYTERTYVNGSLDLCISCDITGLELESVKRFGAVLAAAILDLDSGYMAVGGLTSVGHGMFYIENVNVNGKLLELGSMKAEEKYKVLKTAICGEEEQVC